MKDEANVPIAFSIKAAVSAAPVSRSELYRAMGRGDLKAKKLGKRTIIMRDDLTSYLAGLPNYATAA